MANIYELYNLHKLLNINENDIKTTTQFPLLKNTNIGDIVLFDDYRHVLAFYVGFDNKLIQNPDYTKAGYGSIPLEVSIYLNDPISFYKEELDISSIDLPTNHYIVQNRVIDISKNYIYRYWTDIEKLEMIKI